MNTTAHMLGIIAAMLILAVVVENLRRGRMRERHAVWWIVAGLLAVALGAFPSLLERLAQLAGIDLPVNLVFFGGIAVLFLVTLQHSTELTKLENQTRLLAEHVAILELELEQRASDT